MPQLQLAPILFVPHVLLDAYAFNRAEMFDRHPTTSRAAERTAIDDLADPIVALSLDRRVVRLNPAAESLLGVGAEQARDRPFDAFLDVAIDVESGDADGGDDEITVGVGPRRRTFAVSTAALTDPEGTHVGYTVVFSDVTERERRRQQLEVLNRILRHNLRNDAGVVAGYGDLLVERLEDPELVRMADAIDRRAGALAALGEKAGTVETLLSDGDPTTVDVRELVSDVVDDARERAGEDAVTLAVEGTDAEWVASLRADALQAIVANAVENAVVHHDGQGTERADGGTWVRVTLRREDRGDAAEFVLVVDDDGPGIPDHEVRAVESGRETALEHGSGLGLWVIEWAAGALGADVEYATREPRGTRVTARVPLINDEAGADD